MADMVWRPRFDDADLDTEREVVLEEIAMYEDDPQDKVFDVLGEAVFGDHPLGRRDHRPRRGRRRHAGRARSPPSTTRATRRGNVVVAAAGSVDHDALVELVARRATGAAAALRARRCAPPAPTALAPHVRFVQKDTEQYHVASARPASRATTSAASRCACSTRSSAARRPRACSRRCASSAAWPTPSTRSQSQYADTGQIGLYLGTRPDNVAPALEVVARRARRACARDGVTRRRARARQGERQGPHRAVAGVDRRAHEPPRRLGAHGLPLLSVDEVVERIDAVTLDDVAALAARAVRARAPERRRRSAPTRTSSARRSSRSRPSCCGAARA